eukprot:98183_1
MQKNKRSLAKMQQEDPSIFSYDEVYDTIHQKRDELFREKEREKTLRPVRYINTIQKESSKRQIRHDSAREKILLKERKETDHLFENKQKYITRAYREQLKEIEQQRINDKIQSNNEQTIQNDHGMFGFFNGYLQHKTGGNRNKNKKSQRKSVSRSRSRSRSRERDSDSGKGKGKDNKMELNEEQRYRIDKHKQELSKQTFNEDKQKKLDEIALGKCNKRTTNDDLKALRERYLKRKAVKKT